MKRIPKRSNASRSYQSAEAQMPVTESTVGRSPSSQATFSRSRLLLVTDIR